MTKRMGDDGEAKKEDKVIKEMKIVMNKRKKKKIRK